MTENKDLITLMRDIPQPLTEKQKQYYQKEYLKHVNNIIDYCANSPSLENDDIRKRLELLAFSILSAIDGESGAIGGFMMVPLPNEDIKIPDNISNYDIAGSLHDQLHKFK